MFRIRYLGSRMTSTRVTMVRGKNNSITLSIIFIRLYPTLITTVKVMLNEYRPKPRTDTEVMNGGGAIYIYRLIKLINRNS